MKYIVIEDIQKHIDKNKQAQEIFYSIKNQWKENFVLTSTKLHEKIIRGAYFELENIELIIFFVYDNIYNQIDSLITSNNKVIIIPIYDDFWYNLDRRDYINFIMEKKEIIPVIEKSLNDTLIKSTIIHELIHFLDSKTYTPTEIKKHTEKNYAKYALFGKHYYNSDEELNAYWHEILLLLQSKEWNKKNTLKNNIEIALNLIYAEKYLNKFFVHLSTKNKKKILRRIADFLLQ